MGISVKGSNKIEALISMKTFLTIILCVAGQQAFAQYFYIEQTEKGFEKEIISKMDFNGYKIVKTPDQSDYTIRHHYQKNSKNYKFEGYITISNSKDDNEVYRTEIVKKPANAFNGYQAMPQIIGILCDKHLLPELTKNKDKYKLHK
jgi:hypothetical protein